VAKEVSRHDIPNVEGAERILFQYDSIEEVFRALLPSGATPAIRPVNPRTMSRLVQHFSAQEPPIPKISVAVPGHKIAQTFDEPEDKAYLAAHDTWQMQFMNALLFRCIWDALVVPEDDDWAVKYTRGGLPVPAEGPERSEMYAEEVYPTLLGLSSPADQVAFTEAVRQLSMPTDEVVEEVRRKFRDSLAQDGANESEASAGGVHVEHRDGGTPSVSEVSDTGDVSVGDAAS